MILVTPETIPQFLELYSSPLVDRNLGVASCWPAITPAVVEFKLALGNIIAMEPGVGFAIVQPIDDLKWVAPDGSKPGGYVLSRTRSLAKAGINTVAALLAQTPIHLAALAEAEKKFEWAKIAVVFSPTHTYSVFLGGQLAGVSYAVSPSPMGDWNEYTMRIADWRKILSRLVTP